MKGLPFVPAREPHVHVTEPEGIVPKQAKLPFDKGMQRPRPGVIRFFSGNQQNRMRVQRRGDGFKVSDVGVTLSFSSRDRFGLAMPHLGPARPASGRVPRGSRGYARQHPTRPGPCP